MLKAIGVSALAVSLVFHSQAHTPNHPSSGYVLPVGQAANLSVVTATAVCCTYNIDSTHRP